MKERLRATDGGFRWILVLGAIVSIVIAVWGLVWTSMLEGVLGVKLPARAAAGAYGLARLYGATMLAIGIGYALAAAQPHRSRSLLVPLFVVPAVTAIAMIAGISRGEIRGGQGTVFIVYNLAYALLYFRLYPRVPPEREAAAPRSPQAPPE